jgi:GNAT superfamily N-acetyltransferase
MSDTPITIRPAAADDSPRLTALSAQLGYPVPEEELRARLVDHILPDPDCVLYVAQTAAGEVIGWAHGFVRPLLTDPIHVELGGLVVDEYYRNQRIGERLMEHIEAWARERGCRAVYVRSNVKREQAHRFYLRIGYQVIKTSLTLVKSLANPSPSATTTYPR